MGWTGAYSAVKGGWLVRGGMRGFVFGTSGSSWAHDEKQYEAGKLEAYVYSQGNHSRRCEARVGNGFRARDLDQHLMQLGKCLANYVLPEE